jgi:hypothetical protein
MLLAEIGVAALLVKKYSQRRARHKELRAKHKELRRSQARIKPAAV